MTTDIIVLQIMYSLKLILPDDRDRARLLGKENRKLKDIEHVSGASLTIEQKYTVHIRADTKEALTLAEGMVRKSLKHRRAAEIGTVHEKEVENAVLWDLLLAVHYTYCDI